MTCISYFVNKEFGCIQMMILFDSGLFRGAIAQSGSALCHWAVASSTKPQALELAEKLGCVGETSAELAECLREQELQKLLVAQAEMTVSNV